MSDHDLPATPCLTCKHHRPGTKLNDAPAICWTCNQYNKYAPNNIGIETPNKVISIYPMDTQVGGSHYKELPIQPMEYSLANKLDACQHTAIKYVTRFRHKGGIEDLRKAIHTIEMLIEFEERERRGEVNSQNQSTR